MPRSRFGNYIFQWIVITQCFFLNVHKNAYVQSLYLFFTLPPCSIILILSVFLHQDSLMGFYQPLILLSKFLSASNFTFISVIVSSFSAVFSWALPDHTLPSPLLHHDLSTGLLDSDLSYSIFKLMARSLVITFISYATCVLFPLFMSIHNWFHFDFSSLQYEH